MEGFLSVQPSELKFPFESEKQSCCSIQLVNRTNQFIAFRVRTTQTKKYCVRPNHGVVSPNSVCHMTVTMQAQKEALLGMQCKDKFMVQCVVAPNGATVKDVTPDMFNKEEGKLVNEFVCKVVYVPANNPCPVPEGNKGRTSAEISSADNVKDLRNMSSGNFLRMEPSELKFPFELKKQSSCVMQLVNETNQFIAFKVKTTERNNYCVRPHTGVLLPNSVSNFTVTMQAQATTPPDMRSSDKLCVRSVIAPIGATVKDVTPDMFDKKKNGKRVNEQKIPVVYVPVNTPSPVPNGNKEGTYPETSSATDNMTGASIVSQALQVLGSLNQSMPNRLSTEVRIITKMMNPNGCREELVLKYECYPESAHRLF